ncbi:MAG: hypothetical protein [Chaetfec virus UA24_2292]|nr:MAG: hypothetical protein [Chaetfec virus UA24_2292]
MLKCSICRKIHYRERRHTLLLYVCRVWKMFQTSARGLKKKKYGWLRL